MSAIVRLANLWYLCGSMKHFLIAIAALLLGVSAARAQEPATLEGTWCLCEILSFDASGEPSGGMTVGKDYIEFRADGTCVMLASKQEKEYSYDAETGALVIGIRKAKVVQLTSDELVWEEVSGGNTMRYRLRKK